MYITILDYNDGTVARIELSKGMSYEDYEQVIMDKGFKLNNIEWMAHSDGEIYEY